jgi:hypothetical protein
MKENPIVRSADRACVLGLLLAATMATSAEEVISNGNFSSGLAHWRMHPSLASWNPLSEGAVLLHPPSWSYQGTVVYQNLNVTVEGGASAVLSVRLKKYYAPTGKSLSFELDYITTSGQANRIGLLSPDNDGIDDWGTQTATVSLPADASKVVRLVVNKQGYGEFLMDDVSLSIAGTARPVPVITSAGPLFGPLSATNRLTLRGTDLGTTGQVIIGGWPADLAGYHFGAPTAQIESWSSTEIVARVAEPLRSGGIYVVTDGVEANGDFDYTITSPTFTVDPVVREITAVRGQAAELLLYVNFLNGFTSENGVNFMIMDPPDLGESSDQPLKSTGGFRFALNTSSLATGTHRCMAQSMEDKSYARFIPFSVKVVTISAINFFEYDDNYERVTITSKTVTKQGEVYIYSEALDNEGKVLGENQSGPPGASPIVAVSSDPSKLMVFNDKFGQRFFAQASGNVTLTFSAPGGFTRELPVTIDLPSAPFVDTAVHTMAAADNSGLTTNVFSMHATEPIGWIGYEGFINANMDTITRDSATSSASWPFQIVAGTQPGDYLFYAEAGGAKRYAVLTVVNTPSRGQITGELRTLGDDSMGGQDLFGTLECYDAAQSLVSTNRIEAYGSTAYLASYIAPGTYRVRFVPDGQNRPPVWHPGSLNFAGAAPVTVAAGATVSNINFYIPLQNAAPTNYNLTKPSFETGNVTMKCETLAGVTYHLEATESLENPNWVTVFSLTGDGGTRTLADAAPPARGRFYRIRFTTP